MSLRTAALFCAIALAPYTHTSSRVDAAAADASDATRGVDQQPQAQLAEQPGAGELNELNLIGAADGVPLPTEADMLAHVAEWERRVAAADPAVWEAQIRQHRAGHAAGKRRRLQEEQQEEAARNWDLETLGDLDVDNTRSVLDQPAAVRIGEAGAGGSTICNDPLASNTGSSFTCTYECDDLTDHYFPGEAAETTCFIYNVATGQWPQDGFMSEKKDKLLWHIFADETNPTQAVEFTGEQRDF
jgi:hypothetical protein